MTDVASEPLHAPDPRASELSSDDPRLRLARPRARAMRAAPAALLVASVLGAGLLGVGLAFRRPQTKRALSPQASGPPPPPQVPDAIRLAQVHPAAITSPQGCRPAERAARVASADGPELFADREIDRKARTAGILFEAASGAPGRPAPEPLQRAGSVAPERPGGDPAPSEDGDPILQAGKDVLVGGPPGASPAGDVQAPLRSPRSPYEIQAGTVLPAVLVTAINSDLPGPVVAQVREHVYDTVTGNHLLVPQGSRLIASYDSRVSWGQERVLLCWNRLILPDGDWLDLPCTPAADLEGAAGLADRVDEHWWRILKGAAVATLLSAGTAFVSGDTTSYNPTAGQVLTRSASAEIGQVGAQVTRENLGIRPTITVRPGFSVNAIVTRDMVLPPYPDPPTALGVVR